MSETSSEASGFASKKVLPLSATEALILELLSECGREMFGLELVEASSGKLKRGTIYVTLQRMKEKGFVSSKPEPRCAPEIGIPRRCYLPTALGELALASYQAAKNIWMQAPIPSV